MDPVFNYNIIRNGDIYFNYTFDIGVYQYISSSMVVWIQSSTMILTLESMIAW